MTEQVEVPFYLRKAERPKTPRAVNLHIEDVELLNSVAYKYVSSSFVRYLFDCYRAKITPTDEGFVKYRMSGEKKLK